MQPLSRTISFSLCSISTFSKRTWLNRRTIIKPPVLRTFHLTSTPSKNENYKTKLEFDLRSETEPTENVRKKIPIEFSSKINQSGILQQGIIPTDDVNGRLGWPENDAYIEQSKSRTVPILATLESLHPEPSSSQFTNPLQSQMSPPQPQQKYEFPLKADPLLSHLVNMIMRDGKKARAEKIVQDALLRIQLETHNDPVKILKDAIGMIRPLVRVNTNRRGTKNIFIPVALNERQSHHRAIKWLLEAGNKRPEREFSQRLGMEVLAVINGVSTCLQ